MAQRWELRHQVGGADLVRLVFDQEMLWITLEQFNWGRNPSEFLFKHDSKYVLHISDVNVTWVSDLLRSWSASPLCAAFSWVLWFSSLHKDCSVYVLFLWLKALQLIKCNRRLPLPANKHQQAQCTGGWCSKSSIYSIEKRHNMSKSTKVQVDFPHYSTVCDIL